MPIRVLADFAGTTAPGRYSIKAFDVIVGAINVGSVFVIAESAVTALASSLLCLAALRVRGLRKKAGNA